MGRNHPIISSSTLISKCLILLGTLFLSACDNLPFTKSGDQDPSQIPATQTACDPQTYNLDCLKSESTSASDEIISTVGGWKKSLIDATADEVPPSREEEYGEATKQQISSTYPILSSHPKLELLQGLLHKLLSTRIKPSELNYNIYVVQGQDVNAFTVGAEIFVTTALLDAVESTDELACVIGHEIGHNELGHIADQIKEQELAKGIFGDDVGAAVAGAVGLITMSFNQIKEAQADLYGIDLVLSTGYDPCKGIAFWQRMEKEEGPASEWDNLIRTHPYSTRRANCYRTHLATYHDRTCN